MCSDLHLKRSSHFEIKLSYCSAMCPFRKLIVAAVLVTASTTLDVTAQPRGENEGWFGITYESAAEDTDVGALARSTEIIGAKVTFVSKNGPSAGILSVDDVVVQVGKERVTDQTSLKTTLRLIGPDQPVDIAVIRNEKLLWLEIETSQPPMLVEVPVKCFLRTRSTTAFIWPNQNAFSSFREDVMRAAESLRCAPDHNVLTKIEGVFDRAAKQGITPHELINFEANLTAALGRGIDTVDDWYDANGLPTNRPTSPEKLTPMETFVGSSSIESLTIAKCVKILAQISLMLNDLGDENLADLFDLKAVLTEVAGRENPELLKDTLQLVKRHLTEVTSRNYNSADESFLSERTYACWHLSPALNEVLSLTK